MFKMNLKEFFKITKKKILISSIIFVIIILLSFSLGRRYQEPFPELSTEEKPFGGLFPYKLNSFLWLPTPLISGEHNYIEYFPVDLGKILLVTIPYWVILSYILSCLVIFVYDKIRKKE